MIRHRGKSLTDIQTVTVQETIDMPCLLCYAVEGTFCSVGINLHDTQSFHRERVERAIRFRMFVAYEKG